MNSSESLENLQEEVWNDLEYTEKLYKDLVDDLKYIVNSMSRIDAQIQKLKQRSI